MKAKKLLLSLLTVLGFSFSALTITSCGHDHTWYEANRVNATCLNNGYIENICTECDEITYEGIAATGHIEVIDVAIEPTCDKTGLTEGKHCSVCDMVLDAQKFVETKGHSYENDICNVCGYPKATEGLNLWQSEGGYLVRGIGTATDKNIVIPSTYNGMSVTSLYTGAFSHCSKLNSITIPDSVTSIGEYAFNNCTSLTTVYYTGTEEQWNAITISSNGNFNLKNANIIFNYEG